VGRVRMSELQQRLPGTSQQGPVPGYLQEPRPGPLPGPGGRRGFSPTRRSGSDDTSPEDDLAGLVLTETARFVGRVIGRLLQRTYTERVLPALAARGEEMLRTQIAIGDKYPDLCACFTDRVIFLAGGRRVLPLPDLSAITVEQADALVATLRSG